MLELSLSLIDRLVQLVGLHKTNNRVLFSDHVEPLFLDMAVVHKDYLTAFEETADKARIHGLSADMIQQILTEKKLVFESLRVKSHTLAKVLKSSDLTSHDPIQGFVASCTEYFTAGSGRVKDVYYGHYSDLLDFMDQELLSKPIEDGDHFVVKLYEVTRTVRDKWQNVTFAYANARVGLLK